MSHSGHNVHLQDPSFLRNQISAVVYPYALISSGRERLQPLERRLELVLVKISNSIALSNKKGISAQSTFVQIVNLSPSYLFPSWCCQSLEKWVAIFNHVVSCEWNGFIHVHIRCQQFHSVFFHLITFETQDKKLVNDVTYTVLHLSTWKNHDTSCVLVHELCLGVLEWPQLTCMKVELLK